MAKDKSTKPKKKPKTKRKTAFLRRSNGVRKSEKKNSKTAKPEKPRVA